MKRKTDIILLAAGNSSRFGKENKMHHRVNGESMFFHTVKIALEVRRSIFDIIENVIVVTTQENAEILPEEVKGQVKLVYNMDSKRGISSSIHLGVKNSEKEKNLLFMVCDQPYLCPKSVENLIRGFYKSISEGAVEYGCLYSEKMGMVNPCIFSYSNQEKLLSLSGDKGGKKILLQNPKKVYCHYIENEKELQDIDTISHRSIVEKGEK